MKILLILSFALSVLWGRNGNESLNHYALQKLNNSGLAASVSSTFKATGTPLFLIHDLKLGLKPGDFIRFKDKMVLVDNDVWQTLQNMGVLKELKGQGVLQLKAKAKSRIWKNRANLVKSEREKKAYLLAGEILKVFEDYFGQVPSGKQMVLDFSGSHLSASIPREILDKLRFTRVKKVPKSGTPFFLPVLDTAYKVGDSLNLQLWAIDPSEPSSSLKYSLLDSLPEGLVWDEDAHTFSGRLAEPKNLKLNIRVSNSAKKSATKELNLLFLSNQAPYPQEINLQQVAPNSVWTYPFFPSDPDDYPVDLKVTFRENVNGVYFDSEKHTLNWLVPKELPAGSTSVFLSITDPYEGRTEVEIPFKMKRPEELLYTKGFGISNPIDTITQFHPFVWKRIGMGTPNAEILEVKSNLPVSLFHRNDSLKIAFTPETPGLLPLQISLLAQGQRLELYDTLFVKENQPPQIEATLNHRQFNYGQVASIYPKISDPDGDEFQWTAQMDGKPLDITQKQVAINTQEPGAHVLWILAKDEYDQKSFHALEYEVVDPIKKYLSTYVETHVTPSNFHLDLQVRRENFRVGLYSSNPTEHNPGLPLADQYWPFIYVGGSWAGAKAMAEGKHFSTDIGFNIRAVSSDVLGGGYFLRGQLKWRDKQATIPWKTNAGLTFYMKQAMVLLLDTEKPLIHFATDFDARCGGFAEGSVEREQCLEIVLEDHKETLPSCGTLSDPDTQSSECTEFYSNLGMGDGFATAIKEMKSTDNVVSMIHAETLFQLFPHFLLGPTFWRLDHYAFPDNLMVFGGALQTEWEWSWGAFESTLHMGYGRRHAKFTRFFDDEGELLPQSEAEMKVLTGWTLKWETSVEIGQLGK